MLSNIKDQLIIYFEQLRDKCKQPENKEVIQKEIDRLKGVGIIYTNEKGEYIIP